MPEVLTMIQTDKNTPAPAVLFVVSSQDTRCLTIISLCNTGESYYYLQALLSLLYLTSSNIVLLINYVGFATWVNFIKVFSGQSNN